ncbi:hypothetical protein HY772_08200 [Candidatus Woesearchaeota archaeon]|nr:hypothetical protein [Candidatus Woesearchaeota archaeon]
MRDISNKTLAILVGIGILFSMGGLIASITASINYPALITGNPVANVSSGTGSSTLKVKSHLVLNITDAAINLGDLALGETNSSEETNDFFVVQNDGSVDFNVFVYGAAATDSPFTSTTDGANTLPNNYYLVHANSTESGTANATYTPVPSTAANKRLLISGLQKQNSVDSAKIGIKVTVPIDEPAGNKSAALTIYVEQS